MSFAHLLTLYVAQISITVVAQLKLLQYARMQICRAVCSVIFPRKFLFENIYVVVQRFWTMALIDFSCSATNCIPRMIKQRTPMLLPLS